MDEKWITRKKSLHASQGFQQKNNLEKCPVLSSYINTYMMTFKHNKFFRILFTISLQCNVLHCRENVSWLLNFFFFFLSFTASKWQLGQDSVWVQDTENSKTSYCGHCPCGHWWLRSRVRCRYRASLLLVKSSAGMCRGESWDYWTDSWRDQPHCTYEYWGLFWPCGKIFIVPFNPVQDIEDL